MRNKFRKTIPVIFATMIAISLMTLSAYADVAGAVQQTWDTAKGQVQAVVNNMICPEQQWTFTREVINHQPPKTLVFVMQMGV